MRAHFTELFAGGRGISRGRIGKRVESREAGSYLIEVPKWGGVQSDACESQVQSRRGLHAPDSAQELGNPTLWLSDLSIHRIHHFEPGKTAAAPLASQSNGELAAGRGMEANFL
jgi:hypothetical protein